MSICNLRPRCSFLILLLESIPRVWHQNIPVINQNGCQEQKLYEIGSPLSICFHSDIVNPELWKHFNSFQKSLHIALFGLPETVAVHRLGGMSQRKSMSKMVYIVNLWWHSSQTIPCIVSSPLLGRCFRDDKGATLNGSNDTTSNFHQVFYVAQCSERTRFIKYLWYNWMIFILSFTIYDILQSFL